MRFLNLGWENTVTIKFVLTHYRVIEWGLGPIRSGLLKYLVPKPAIVTSFSLVGGAITKCGRNEKKVDEGVSHFKLVSSWAPWSRPYCRKWKEWCCRRSFRLDLGYSESFPGFPCDPPPPRMFDQFPLL